MFGIHPIIRKIIFWFKLTMTLTSSSLIASAEGASVESDFVIMSFIEDTVTLVMD